MNPMTEPCHKSTIIASMMIDELHRGREINQVPFESMEGVVALLDQCLDMAREAPNTAYKTFALIVAGSLLIQAVEDLGQLSVGVEPLNTEAAIRFREWVKKMQQVAMSQHGFSRPMALCGIDWSFSTWKTAFLDGVAPDQAFYEGCIEP